MSELKQSAKIIGGLLLLSALFINPIFWLFSFYADYQRSFFNLDYSLLVFLIVLTRRKTFYYLIPLLVLTCLLTFIDAISTASSVYYFVSISSILSSLKYTLYANLEYVFIALFLVIMGLLFLVLTRIIALKIMPKSLKKEIYVMFFLVVIFLSVIEDFKLKNTSYEHIKEQLNEEIVRDLNWIHKDSPFLFSSQSMYMYANMNTPFKQAVAKKGSELNELIKADQTINQKIKETKPWSTEIASAGVIDHSRVFLIVVESLGMPDNPNEFSILYPSLEKIIALSKKSTVKTVAFVGSTVPNEIRELCNMSYNAPTPNFISNFETCLPLQMDAKGIPTYSLHAASKGMYDRAIWYPKVGFKHIAFLEDLPNIGRAHSFPGGLDVNLMPIAKKILDDNPKSLFLYWLTLNSHFPFDKRDAKGSTYDCPESFNDELCRYAKIHDRYFNALYEILKDQKDLTVIITGDHAPPFLKHANQSLFTNMIVPSIRLDL